ncbi:DUF3267 domain-containing protein [Atopobium fossor]|uniref:DUF3267 domain-containing protein n=1 Tax=Atopobium fossor TaxID=39487 RepID=UPI000400507B|nr:DUF3267 domain-containing protein [Atopobium fossor]
MIVIKPSINDIKAYQRGQLPKNAIKLDTPPSIDELTKQASPIAAILCAFLCMTMFIKTIVSHTMVVSILAVISGFIAGFVLLIVHEWLHAIVYPKAAKVTIGKLKGKMMFVALASHPLTRRRFILMSLLPFILGLVPLIIFVITPAEQQVLNGIMFGMAGMGIVSPYLDVYNVITVLKQAHKKDKIMFYEDDIYKIPS